VVEERASACLQEAGEERPTVYSCRGNQKEGREERETE
jgi:hypothetical protein